MRKPTLLALTTLTALGTTAAAGTAFGTGSTLTSARKHVRAGSSRDIHTSLASARTHPNPDSSLPPTIRGGRDLVAIHDINHVARWNLDPKTGLPPKPKPKPKPKPQPKPAAAVVSAPVVTPPPPPPPAPTTTTAAPAAPLGGAWYQLRMCESGDNYAENTGNGYYGAYQFALQTWYGLGFSGLPSQAPPAVQDQAARELQARSGWGQWPQCAAKLGLY